MPNQFKRVTVVTKIYHQIPGEDASHTAIGFTRRLQEDEQPFIRDPRSPAPIEWAPLELAWLSGRKISIVILKNKSVCKHPDFLQEDDDFLYVKYSDSKFHFVIPPGEGLPFTPSDPTKLLVGSNTGLTRYSITVLPG